MYVSVRVYVHVCVCLGGQVVKAAAVCGSSICFSISSRSVGQSDGING